MSRISKGNLCLIAFMCSSTKKITSFLEKKVHYSQNLSFRVLVSGQRIHLGGLKWEVLLLDTFLRKKLRMNENGPQNQIMIVKSSRLTIDLLVKEEKQNANLTSLSDR